MNELLQELLQDVYTNSNREDLVLYIPRKYVSSASWGVFEYSKYDEKRYYLYKRTKL